MKTTIILVAFFTIISCKPQNKQQEEDTQKIKHYKMENSIEYKNLIDNKIEFFDIKKFYKDNPAGIGKTIEQKDGTVIEDGAGENGGWFLSYIKFKKSSYMMYKLYNSKGIINKKGVNFYEDCKIGIWYDFDDNGKLIKETNLDKPYKISVEDIQQFLVQNKASFDRFISVSRNYNQKTKVGTWNIQYDGLYKEKFGRYRIEIDDQSTEIQQVIRVTGKHGEKEIVFKK